MFTRLIESRRRRERSAGATTLSVIAHVTALGLGANLVARDPPPKALPPERIIFAPARPAEHHPGAPRAGVTRCAACRPSPPVPRPIDVSIPVDVIPSGPPIEQPGFPIGPGGPESPSNGSPGDPGGGFTETPDEPARAFPGNPRPEYPAMLRNLGVEAVVPVRYVIDTTGRVEPRSITFEGGTDALFEMAVRRALLASRFEPARTRDRVVRMLVRQDFAFRLTR